jgi:hypothetical protein
LKTEKSLAPIERIEGLIHLVRGHRIIMDNDLAAIYGVSTKVFNQAIKRNIKRFPEDFIFKLTFKEVISLRSQIVTSNGHGGRRYLPYAFTEHGALMAATVLNSPRAVEMSVLVVRAFVHFRNILINHKQLAIKLEELERKLLAHDEKFEVVFEAIRELMEPPPDKHKRRIGFSSEES